MLLDTGIVEDVRYVSGGEGRYRYFAVKSRRTGAVVENARRRVG
jgi:hypothetical protein